MYWMKISVPSNLIYPNLTLFVWKFLYFEHAVRFTMKITIFRMLKFYDVSFPVAACQALIPRLLDPDSSTRLTMAQIFVQPWINDGHSSAPPRVLPVATDQQLNPSVIQYMTEVLNADKNEIRTSVSQRKVNGLSAIYHLLRKRLNKGQGFPDPDKVPWNRMVKSNHTEINPQQQHGQTSVGKDQEMINAGAAKYVNDIQKAISAKDLYETADKHYTKERALSAQQKDETKEIDSVRDTSYKDCLLQLRTKSGLSMPGSALSKSSMSKHIPKPASSMSSHAFVSKSRATSRFDSDLYRGSELCMTPASRQTHERATLVTSPRSSLRSSGRLRVAYGGTRHVFNTIGNVQGVKSTLNQNPLNSNSSEFDLQTGFLNVKILPMSVHKREALRRMREDVHTTITLPPPPPNSAMGNRGSGDMAVHERTSCPLMSTVSKSLPRFGRYHRVDCQRVQPVPCSPSPHPGWSPAPRSAWDAAVTSNRYVITVPTAANDDI